MEKKEKILVIEDSKKISELIEIYIGTHYHVIVAETGEEGLDRIKGEEIDLVLLDIVLPEMNGSRRDAVKQNLDFWRTKPKELPKSHSIPRVTDFPVSKMPTMTITIKRASP